MAEHHPIPTSPLFQNLSGQTFGRLTVLQFAGKRSSGMHIYLCQCSCGNQKTINRCALTTEGTRSCGCLHRDANAHNERAKKHGGKGTAEYRAWQAMKRRCDNLKSRNYRLYGGRGIRVCDRWLHSFPTFLADMGPRPSPAHSIDRIDSDGSYEPGNCRWATAEVQSQNRRSARLITFRGETLSLTAWAARIGVRPSALWLRLSKGWPLERALAPGR